MSRSPRDALRAWAADTTAMVVFCTVTGMAVELGLSGLSLTQSVASRVAAVPLNLLTARPYGQYRDWLWRVARAGRRPGWGRALIDVAAFTSFQVPIYATVLLLAGAEPGQALTACGTLAVLSAFLGRPYGLFLEHVRRVLGRTAPGAGTALEPARAALPAEVRARLPR